MEVLHLVHPESADTSAFRYTSVLRSTHHEMVWRCNENPMGGTPSRYTPHLRITGLGSAVGRVSTPRSGGTRFVPGPRHTKVFNNSASCSPIGNWIFGVGLGQGLVYCYGSWYKVK